MRKPTDPEILECVRARSGSIQPTYFIKNMLREKFPGVTTPWVLRRLKGLEKAGYVVRRRSNFAVHICWDVAAPTSPGEGK